MKNSTEDELLSWKRRLDEAKSRISELSGERKSLEKRIRDEYGIDPKDVNKELSKLGKDMSKLTTKLESLKKELEEKFVLDDE